MCSVFCIQMATGDHKPWHDYQVIEQNTYPIFDKDWGADEELLLVQGCETFGLGNWQDIADHIGNRSKDEVKNHYFDIYLNSKEYPLPEMDKDFSDITPSKFLEQRKERLQFRKNMPLPPPKSKSVASVPLCHEIQGFMPGRLEFDVEAENDAEVPVKDMVFDPEDSLGDIEVKLTILDIYNSRLTTRAERKRVLLLNNLLEYRKNISIDKRKSKEEKDLLKKINALIRILTPEDFNDFSRDILTELKCRIRILQLQHWRRNGITTIEDGGNVRKGQVDQNGTLPKNGQWCWIKWKKFGGDGRTHSNSCQWAQKPLVGELPSTRIQAKNWQHKGAFGYFTCCRFRIAFERRKTVVCYLEDPTKTLSCY